MNKLARVFLMIVPAAPWIDTFQAARGCGGGGFVDQAAYRIVG